MRINAKVYVLAKLAKPWIDSNGHQQTSYSVNISQNDGEIIDTLRIPEACFALVQPNSYCEIVADYGIGKNGGYLRVLNISEAK